VPFELFELGSGPAGGISAASRRSSRSVAPHSIRSGTNSRIFRSRTMYYSHVMGVSIVPSRCCRQPPGAARGVEDAVRAGARLWRQAGHRVAALRRLVCVSAFDSYEQRSSFNELIRPQQ
jgi:hypothetical protein